MSGPPNGNGRLVETTLFAWVGRGAVMAVLGVSAWLVTQVIELDRAVDTMRSLIPLQTSDRYRAQDAARDFQLRDARLDGLERDVRGLLERSRR